MYLYLYMWLRGSNSQFGWTVAGKLSVHSCSFVLPCTYIFESQSSTNTYVVVSSYTYKYYGTPPIANLVLRTETSCKVWLLQKWTIECSICSCIRIRSRTSHRYCDLPRDNYNPTQKGPHIKITPALYVYIMDSCSSTQSLVRSTHSKWDTSPGLVAGKFYFSSSDTSSIAFSKASSKYFCSYLPSWKPS